MNTAFGKSAKMILAGLAIAALSASAYARSSHDCGYGMPGQMSDRQIERMEKMREEHQARLHEKLKLTAQQESAWKKFTASQPFPDKTALDPTEMRKLSAPQRMEKGLEHMRAMEKTMTEHMAALKEFYAVLTPEQQKIFDEQTPRFGDRRGYRGQ
ncbi:MAG: Spy/CpxP family protein refolding chaperone [Gammaproteobacteria bacterium]|nr:Spy/CpxP family protein refolding chaperone [Gammaproteobacteria bacterium]MBU1481366.1 Spy/CpxP family protein refolding chaperone [Gammaproteobacteria bacterium]